MWLIRAYVLWQNRAVNRSEPRADCNSIVTTARRRCARCSVPVSMWLCPHRCVRVCDSLKVFVQKSLALQCSDRRDLCTPCTQMFRILYKYENTHKYRWRPEATWFEWSHPSAQRHRGLWNNYVYIWYGVCLVCATAFHFNQNTRSREAREKQKKNSVTMAQQHRSAKDRKTALNVFEARVVLCVRLPNPLEYAIGT